MNFDFGAVNTVGLFPYTYTYTINGRSIEVPPRADSLIMWNGDVATLRVIDENGMTDYLMDRHAENSVRITG